MGTGAPPCLSMVPGLGTRQQNGCEARGTDPSSSTVFQGEERCCALKAQALMLSLSALATVILTTLSAGFWICSPVEGFRAVRSGRSRQ